MHCIATLCLHFGVLFFMREKVLKVSIIVWKDLQQTVLSETAKFTYLIERSIFFSLFKDELLQPCSQIVSPFHYQRHSANHTHRHICFISSIRSTIILKTVLNKNANTYSRTGISLKKNPNHRNSGARQTSPYWSCGCSPGGSNKRWDFMPYN